MNTPRLTRRRFLRAGTAAAALAALPPSLRRALASRRPTSGTLDDVEHVVMLMQENRSFDTYFGKLGGVRGFDDPDRKVFRQPDPKNPDGYELPFHFDTFTTSAGCAPSLSHAWTAQHESWNGGKMDGWIAAHRKSNGDTIGPLTMGYYTRSDIPFHYALADAFTLCENYHCSIMGPTRSNRLYAQTGTIDPDGKNGGPIIDNSELTEGQLTYQTYAEQLQHAGVSWRMYYTDYGNMLRYFKQFQDAGVGSPLHENGMLQRDISAFESDVKNGRLPQVSWLTSNFEDSEHPAFHPANGAMYIYNVLEILAQNPDVWAKTVLFLTYDENDGYFDHVAPPTAPPGTVGEYLTVSPLPRKAGGIAGPIGLGFRVPMLVISPWSVGGHVASEVFDHTSMLRFCETRFGVRASNISAWRRATVGDLTSTLNLRSASQSFPILGSPAPTADQEDTNCNLPAPTVPASQSMPHQDTGSPWPRVARGHTGRRVTTAQYLLRAHGYSLAVDGDFGPVTQSRVEAFQKANGLTVDGTVESSTWEKLIIPAKNGNTGDAVRAIQAQLRVHGYALTVDGDFRPHTQRKVEAFQQLWLLDGNGTVETATWQALVY